MYSERSGIRSCVQRPSTGCCRGMQESVPAVRYVGTYWSELSGDVGSRYVPRPFECVHGPLVYPLPITAQRVLVALEAGDGRPRCRTVN
jgi:hypothetical protein